MHGQLKKALEFANYRQTFSIQRKILKEKIAAKLTLGYNGGLFHIDQTLLTFVEMLLTKGRINGVVLLDNNENPILIEDLEAFRDQCFDRYFEATNEYFEQDQNLKKSRSVEKLLEQ
jgi:hypothetical protein